MIRWSNNFSVSHQGIDEQHKKLISIIEEVAFIISKKDNGLTNLLEVLNELDHYVDEHFKYKEALMKKYSYPEAEEHIDQHNELRNKMAELNVFDINKPEEFFKDLLVYLVDWLSSHIMKTDKRLGIFLTGGSA